MASSAVSSLLGNKSTTSTSTLPNKMALKAEDFINLMVTELKNQDPTKPASNEELLSQMSQIGQLQSSNDLTTSLKTMVLQNSLGSASGMIGKTVAGLNDAKENVTGIVNSVRVEDSNVYLELDNGKTLQMSNVTSVAPNGSSTGATTDSSTDSSTGIVPPATTTTTGK